LRRAEYLVGDRCYLDGLLKKIVPIAGEGLIIGELDGEIGIVVQPAMRLARARRLTPSSSSALTGVVRRCSISSSNAFSISALESST
jgi:hypothetical protein